MVTTWEDWTFEMALNAAASVNAVECWFNPGSKKHRMPALLEVEIPGEYDNRGAFDSNGNWVPHR